MFKFNSDHIFVGYIKQLLASFNLPNYKVYTADKKIIESKLDEKTMPYIKDGSIQFCIDAKNNVWHDTGIVYYYNKHNLNNTKNYVIKNNVYDSYTHEYLGEFLRFQRDYNHINLMSLYNCFSNRLVDNLNLKCPAGSHNIEFNSSDLQYKIYMLPVKLEEIYTIAIECEAPVEICCGLYGAYQDTRDEFKDIQCLTYTKISGSKFTEPFIYSKLKDIIESPDINWVDIANNENNLKMFIKVPAGLKSTITVLEGEYLNINTKNHTVINVDSLDEVTNANVKLISQIQLLKMNTGESYPFANRLLEYIIENTITDNDEITDNIRRVQKVLEENNIFTTVNGAWESKMNFALYEATINNVKANKEDLLGYVDKDVEQTYYSSKNTLRDVDLYENGGK